MRKNVSFIELNKFIIQLRTKFKLWIIKKKKKTYHFLFTEIRDYDANELLKNSKNTTIPISNLGTIYWQKITYTQTN